MNAPRLSPAPSNPNAFPLCCSSEEEAINASRGADLVAEPMRSKKRAPSTQGHVTASHVKGLAKAESIYPNKAIAFLFCHLSDNQPENPCTMFFVASAMPSTMPTIPPLALR